MLYIQIFTSLILINRMDNSDLSTQISLQQLASNQTQTMSRTKSQLIDLKQIFVKMNSSLTQMSSSLTQMSSSLTQISSSLKQMCDTMKKTSALIEDMINEGTQSRKQSQLQSIESKHSQRNCISQIQQMEVKRLGTFSEDNQRFNSQKEHEQKALNKNKNITYSCYQMEKYMPEQQKKTIMKKSHRQLIQKTERLIAHFNYCHENGTKKVQQFRQRIKNKSVRDNLMKRIFKDNRERT